MEPVRPPMPEKAPWLDQMRTHDGAITMTGSSPTDLITEAFSHTNFGPLNGKTPPSCAAGLNMCLFESGMLGTNSAAANSFLDYGTECQMKVGAILVFEFEDGSHHVCIADGLSGDESKVRAIGFNQDHKCQRIVWHTRYIKRICWPIPRTDTI